ncbi:MAG: rod-binding protein, partial [Bdellovibrionales bacterium]|nr:rod-binding protein [Bdellovibrionales bacterium]
RDEEALARTSRLQQKGANAKSDFSAAEMQEMEKAATDFEAMLLRQMFQAMWQSVPKGDLLSGSEEEKLYRDMFNEHLADEVAENASIGIKDVILRDLKGLARK